MNITIYLNQQVTPVICNFQPCLDWNYFYITLNYGSVVSFLPNIKSKEEKGQQSEGTQKSRRFSMQLNKIRYGVTTLKIFILTLLQSFHMSVLIRLIKK